MRRLLIEQANEIIKLEGEDHKHFATVLRANVGDEIETTCGDGFVYIYQAFEITKTYTKLKKVNYREDNSEAKHNVTLFMPVLKSDKNELVVQKAVELGVKKIIPFISTFSQAKNIRKERLIKIAREAVMQCGRSFVPEITDVVDFNELICKMNDYNLIVFPYEKATGNDLHTFLLQAKYLDSVGIIIGSEGGFSDKEIAQIYQAGAVNFGLGERILRAETACIATASIVGYMIGV